MGTGLTLYSSTLAQAVRLGGELEFPLLPSGLSSPVLEMGDRPLTREYYLAPSCGFPQKPFPPEGPHGFRGHLRRSGMRASEDGASTAPPCYAACNAPATRSDGALPAHSRPALGTHTVAAALKRASPCERLVSGSTPNEITSCLRTSRSCCSLFRLQRVFIGFKHASNECALVSGSTSNETTSCLRTSFFFRQK